MFTHPTRALVLVAASLPFLAAQPHPLASRTLVVYSTANADSVSVANHYATRRGIPSANLCAIAPPGTGKITEVQYNSSVRGPVRACLDAVGRATILYVVFSHQTPYALSSTEGGKTFSLDGAVADIWDEVAASFPTAPFQAAPVAPHPYYSDPQSQGNRYAPFVSLASYRAQPGAKTIYSVWRLDAATAALSRGLVDMAIQTETSGLTGTACFDRRSGALDLAADESYGAGEFDLSQAAAFARLAGFSVVEDQNSVEFGTAPAALRCDGAALYAGWYSFNNYNDAFTWSPGAIGFHLDSASAANPRTGTNWAANALLRGITVTSGAVSEPYLSGLVHPDGFFRNLFEGANVGDAVLRNAPWTKWMNLNVGDPLYRPFPAGRAPFNPPGPEDGLLLSPRGLLPGTSGMATVFLASPAPAGGALVSLLSRRTSAATVPASVTVPAGAVQASFPVTAANVTADFTALLQATYGGVTRANTLFVEPLLAAIQASPTTIPGGLPLPIALFLNAPAPSGGTVVTIESSASGAIVVPSSVVVPAGQSSLLLSLPTSPVAADVLATLTARHASAARTVTVRVAAPVPVSWVLTPNRVIGNAGVSSVLTLSGPAPSGGTAVTFASGNAAVPAPASIVIPAGSTQATVPVRTTPVPAAVSVTLTARASNVNRTTTLTVSPPFSAVSLTSSVLGGRNATLTVTLSTVAPAGGYSVALTSSNPAVAQPPATLQFAAGQQSLSVPVPTTGVAAPTAVSVTATLLGTARVSNTSTIQPATLYSLSLANSYLRGGTGSSGRVALSGVAPPGGLTVAITSDQPSVTVPSAVVVPGGSAEATFPVSTSPVPASVTATVTATFGSTSRTDTLRLNP